MKPLSFLACGTRIGWRASIVLGTVAGVVASGCAQGNSQGPAQTGSAPQPPAGQVVIDAPPGVPRPPYKFAPDDERLLEEVQRGAFLYLWNEVSPATGMVRDRSSADVVSIAGVGFQLSGLPIGVERGWITRSEAEARALLILRSLLGNPDNRKAGLYYHYLDPKTAGPTRDQYEYTVSTIDSALLFAGVMTASSHLGGEVGRLAQRMIDEANWRFFVLTEGPKPYELGYISLGWKPDDPEKPTGEGRLVPYVWVDCGDEHRLVTFLAVAAPRPEHRMEPELYYRLRRRLGADEGGEPMAWFPWSGALFTHFFAHCWINYSALGPDDPEAFEQEHRARVDWWENSRRAVAMHRRKCAENPRGLPTFSDKAWGLSACDSPRGYSVPGLFPKPIEMPGARPEFDYSMFAAKDDYGDGTIAPYAAGCSILFDPGAAVAALRYYRGLTGPSGEPLVWREPDAEKRHYGFVDAFNLGKMWAAPDCVAIDQGPLLVAIENARTGLIWELFAKVPAVETGMKRLRLSRSRR